MIIKKKIGVVCQCRVSSKRLKNKIILKICGKPILFYLINRLKKIKCDKIIFAVADELGKEKIIDIIKNSFDKSAIYVGSVNNVLERTLQASNKFEIDTIIRVTSDCPFIDPHLINKGIKIFEKKKLDYLSNNLKKTFPLGLDFEIFSTDALNKSSMLSKHKLNKEHVTWFIKKSKKFKKFNISNTHYDERKIRLTLDYMSDYLNFKKILENNLILTREFSWRKLKLLLQNKSNKESCKK